MPRVSARTDSTWEGYLKGLKRRSRRELLRDMRVIDRPDVACEVIRDPEIAAPMFERLIALHTASWKRRGAGGHFRTDEFFEDFLRVVTPLLMKEGRASLLVLKHNGEPIVVTLNFHSARCYVGYITGRDLDNGLSTLSPGKAVLGMSIQDTIEGGYNEFDLLGGVQQYKLQLGGTVSYYGRLVVRQHGRAGLVGWITSALLEVRTAVHIKFYRHRVLPKLNKTFRRPTKPKADPAKEGRRASIAPLPRTTSR
jgi:CelD/BcsL family acetyltransferase involved in cellulose biosynthesis